MARDRQKAKQRQAERRARRLADQGDGDAHLIDDSTAVDPSPAVSPDLAVGAPPTDEGRSDTVIDDEEADEATGAGEAGYEVRGRRGRDDAEQHKHRPRVIQFLIAVWAELQRVQWPNRQALVTLTGVVLGFVLIAGGYLGLLDAIFSELIQALL